MDGMRNNIQPLASRERIYRKRLTFAQHEETVISNRYNSASRDVERPIVPLARPFDIEPRFLSIPPVLEDRRRFRRVSSVT